MKIYGKILANFYYFLKVVKNNYHKIIWVPEVVVPLKYPLNKFDEPSEYSLGVSFDFKYIFFLFVLKYIGFNYLYKCFKF